MELTWFAVASKLCVRCKHDMQEEETRKDDFRALVSANEMKQSYLLGQERSLEGRCGIGGDSKTDFRCVISLLCRGIYIDY